MFTNDKIRKNISSSLFIQLFIVDDAIPSSDILNVYPNSPMITDQLQKQVSPNHTAHSQGRGCVRGVRQVCGGCEVGQ